MSHKCCNDFGPKMRQRYWALYLSCKLPMVARDTHNPRYIYTYIYLLYIYIYIYTKFFGLGVNKDPDFRWKPYNSYLVYKLVVINSHMNIPV